MLYELWKVLLILLWVGFMLPTLAFGETPENIAQLVEDGKIETETNENPKEPSNILSDTISDMPVSKEALFLVVAEKAKMLAKKSYKENKLNLPKNLDELDYQQYRSIRFNPELSIWKAESEFEIQLFHPGFLYKNPINLNLIEGFASNESLIFDSDYFIYDRESETIQSELSLNNEFEQNLGYAGFRIHYPLNSRSYKDELLVFQGASYFRPVGPFQTYGISGRGLAINTGEPEGEEFPYFVEFWLQKPADNHHQLTIFALLDSPSMAGAFWFLVKPGVNTVIDVTAKLYLRKNIKKLGIAPLTSMFLYGENKTQFVDDFRPEIHDSDGLQILTASGEWLWRPLRNPKELSITSSVVENVKGFGLAQRDRNFFSYSDLEAKYEKRPSLWIQPQSEWGAGRIELVEIPTRSETNDNIVAYWVPSDAIVAGSELQFNYRISTFNSVPPNFATAYVTASRTGRAAIPGESDPPPKSHRQFVVDFSGNEISHLSPDTPIQAMLELSSGEFKDLQLAKLPDNQGWRVYFTVMPVDNKVIDMRMNLSLHGERISEVWNYVWNSNAIQ